MVEMIDELNLKLEGRHYSGIDGSKNIARLVLILLILLNLRDCFRQ
jgi:hypothetical protein